MFVSLTVSTALSEDRLPDSPGGLSAAPNLRTAKSYADLRSYTASPETSTASHPISRLSGPNLHGLSFEGATSINPNGTPTTSSMAARDEGLVERELGRMQIGSNFGQGGGAYVLCDRRHFGEPRAYWWSPNFCRVFN